MTLNPEIFTWARNTAGLSAGEAARALGFKNTRDRSAAERLRALETGDEEPSRSVLVRMAKAYRRSLLVFYLAEPPRTGDRGQDFRTLPGHEKFNPELDALLRDIKARQGLIRSMLEDDKAEPLEFVNSATIELPAPKLE